MVKMMAKEASKMMKSSQEVLFLLQSDETKGNPGPLSLSFSESTAVRRMGHHW